jgi:hypothetical protein
MGGGSAPEQIAFTVEPVDIEPARVAQLLQLLIVKLDIGESVVTYGDQLSIMLDLVLQTSQFVHDLLPLPGLLGVVAFGGGSVDIVNGLCLFEMRHSYVSQSVY